MGELVDKKAAAYGNSLDRGAEVMALLCPDGVKPEQYFDFVIASRIFDKIARKLTNNDAFGENPWIDVIGHAMVALRHEEERKQ